MFYEVYMYLQSVQLLFDFFFLGGDTVNALSISFELIQLNRGKEVNCMVEPTEQHKMLRG